MTSQKYAVRKLPFWTRTLGLTALGAIAAVVLVRPLLAATDDSTLKLNSTNGSTEFAIQNGSAQDIFFVNSSGSVQITSNTVTPGTTFYQDGRMINGGMIIGNSAAPGIAGGTGAGSGGTFSLTIAGTNLGGLISLTAGSTTIPVASGIIATITPTIGAPNKYVCAISPANALTAAPTALTQLVMVTGTATTWVMTAGATRLATSGVYAWEYVCGAY